jgi:hypothetical protein
MELEECQHLIEKQTALARSHEQTIQSIEMDLGKQKMITHHAQQEIRRLEALIEVIAHHENEYLIDCYQ